MATASVANDSYGNAANKFSSSKDSEPETISFIRECAFSPVIAILTSYDVEVLCEKNNLSFCELLLPFTQLTSEIVVKDPNNQNVLIKYLRLDFRDLRRDGFLSNAALPLAMGEILRQCQSTPAADTSADNFATEKKLNSGIDMNTPWYEAYRRQFLRLLDPPEYEFNRHYLACILVVSTMHEDPLDQLNRLSQAQHALQHQQGGATNVQLPKHAAAPKWFSPNTFKYHLLLHDVVDGNDQKAESIYQGMKMNYGAHACHLLRINSTPATNAVTSGPNPWAPILRYRLRHFNSLRLHDDENGVLNENNNVGDVATSETSETTIVNGDMVLVGDGQTETLNNAVSDDGTTIPHPLSCDDLAKLENQQNCTAVEKEERAQPASYGQCLTPSDVDRIKIFVQEFSVRGLLPYVERQLRLLNEQVAARRGLHKTFLSFTKNLWGKTGPSGSTPNLQSMGSMSSSSSTTFGYGTASTASLPSPERGNAAAVGPVPSVTYAYESAEMQTRRLADLAVLFQNYDLAYPLYHSLKKEFGTAQAWIHSASAMEFASLCVYLSGPTQSRPYPSHYMEQAMNTYLAVSGNHVLAARVCIYNSGVLCALSDYGQAAAQYIRLSSGDDLRSALFLEQAACCFLRADLRRKAALHLILAGHRYGKAAKRQHTIRCYRAALKSYYGKGWQHALDHIYSTLGEEPPLPQVEKPLPTTDTRKSVSHRAKSLEPSLLKGDEHFPRDASVVTANEVSQDRVPTSNVINCALSCQPMIEHDFIAGGLCRINVGLEVQYLEDAEEFLIKSYTGGMSSPSEFQQFYRGYPLLLWSTSCRRVRLLNDRQSKSENGFRHRRLELSAVVTVPGIYDISSLKFSCRRKESQWEELPLLPSQFVTVIQSPRTVYGQSLHGNANANIYCT